MESGAAGDAVGIGVDTGGGVEVVTATCCFEGSVQAEEMVSKDKRANAQNLSILGLDWFTVFPPDSQKS